MADLHNNERSNQASMQAERARLIERLAEMSDNERQAAIAAKVAPIGATSPAAMALAAKELTQEVEKFKEIKPYNPHTMQWLHNRIDTSATFNKDGYAGQNTSFNYTPEAFKTKNFGTFTADANVANKADGSLASGGLGLKHTNTPFTWKRADIVPIQRLGVNIPADGKVSGQGLVGAVIKEHGVADAINHTIAAIVDDKLKGVTLFTRQSKEMYNNNSFSVTPYVQESAELPSGKVGLGAGALVEKDIGSGSSLFANANVVASDVFNKPDVAGNLTFGWHFGETPKKVQQTSTETEPWSRADELKERKLSNVNNNDASTQADDAKRHNERKDASYDSQGAPVTVIKSSDIAKPSAQHSVRDNNAYDAHGRLLEKAAPQHAHVAEVPAGYKPENTIDRKSVEYYQANSPEAQAKILSYMTKQYENVYGSSQAEAKQDVMADFARYHALHQKVQVATVEPSMVR